MIKANTTTPKKCLGLIDVLVVLILPMRSSNHSVSCRTQPQLGSQFKKVDIFPARVLVSPCLLQPDQSYHCHPIIISNPDSGNQRKFRVWTSQIWTLTCFVIFLQPILSIFYYFYIILYLFHFLFFFFFERVFVSLLDVE